MSPASASALQSPSAATPEGFGEVGWGSAPGSEGTRPQAELQLIPGEEEEGSMSQQGTGIQHRDKGIQHGDKGIHGRDKGIQH